MSYQLDARPEDDLQKLLDGIPDDGEPLLVRLSPEVSFRICISLLSSKPAGGVGRCACRAVFSSSLSMPVFLPVHFFSEHFQSPRDPR